MVVSASPGVGAEGGVVPSSVPSRLGVLDLSLIYLLCFSFLFYEMGQGMNFLRWVGDVMSLSWCSGKPEKRLNQFLFSRVEVGPRSQDVITCFQSHYNPAITLQAQNVCSRPTGLTGRISFCPTFPRPSALPMDWAASSSGFLDWFIDGWGGVRMGWGTKWHFLLGLTTWNASWEQWAALHLFLVSFQLWFCLFLPCRMF